tara:strand:- start:139 stop:396 length:258 start_codon:yes stop_codon:yes gene_type:complete
MAKNKLYEMLKADCMSQITKAELTLDLLLNNPAGIGDHSTEDFYKNANEALSMLTDGKDRLSTLENWNDENNPVEMIKEDDDLPF